MAKKPVQIAFDKKLILFNYLLRQFGIAEIRDLSQNMQSAGSDDIYDGQSGFIRNFIQIAPDCQITQDKLLEYDINIIKHLDSINRSRQANQKIRLKYFQYFTLLFIEYYLDRYTDDTEAFCKDLNSYLYWFKTQCKQKGDTSEISDYTQADLNKIAIWNATGSGKTIILHINILQAKQYLDKRNTENFMLLTPNEGLSEQHLSEFANAGIEAARFNKTSSLFQAPVSVIEVTKLAEQNGDETVAVESFGDTNILFVDEGHTGASGEKWMDYRKRLCASGFSFEYSATFGQAVSGNTKTDMQNEYAKCIIFDYSYKYFYNDGFGKDYNILNLPDAHDEKTLYHYLTACILVFYQQKLLFSDLSIKQNFYEYFIENPLLVFVGSTVNAVRTENKEKVSDVVSVLLFLKRFLENTNNQSIKAVQAVLTNAAGLRYGDTDAFQDSFPYLKEKYGLTIDIASAAVIFNDVLIKVFGSDESGSTLQIVNIKTEGEIALLLGNSERPFGLINVGDTGELIKLCAQNGLETGENQFARSLFTEIQNQTSSINILIGSKKFTTGWNCYRVSTMGLMYVGQNEGSQIIQLFGRGVRLWGYKKSLKRSSVMQKFISGLTPPLYLPYIETLNIFGVKANYMQQFDEFLRKEGLPSSKNISSPRYIPVLKNREFKNKNLQKLSLPQGVSYLKQAPIFIWDESTEKPLVVSLDCYTSLELETSIAGEEYSQATKKNSDIMLRFHKHFDYDTIYMDLIEYKYQKEYLNAIISKSYIKNLLSRTDWYELFLPPSLSTPQSFKDIERFQEYATRLLKKYLDKQYSSARNVWEGTRMQYCSLTEEDENFIENYEVHLNNKENDKAFVNEFELLVKTLEAEHKKGKFLPLPCCRCQMEIYDLNYGLYSPFLKMSKSMEIVVKPQPLNDSEGGFIMKLDNYLKNNQKMAAYEIYLIRNKVRSGLGFFETSGFYPDFILWLIDDKNKNQHIVFVEPHGLGHEQFGSDKMTLHHRIKDYERRLSGSVDGVNITLNSFIISPTMYNVLGDAINTKDAYKESGVFFTEDENYIEELLKKAGMDKSI